MNTKEILLVVGALVVGVLVGLFLLTPSVGGVYNNPTGTVTADLVGDVTGDVTGDVLAESVCFDNGTDYTTITFSGSTTTPSYATSTTSCL